MTHKQRLFAMSSICLLKCNKTFFLLKKSLIYDGGVFLKQGVIRYKSKYLRLRKLGCYLCRCKNVKHTKLLRCVCLTHKCLLILFLSCQQTNDLCIGIVQFVAYRIDNNGLRSQVIILAY